VKLLGRHKLNLLFIGDIVGSSGRKLVKEKLYEIQNAHNIDITIANAENVAGGLGITSSLASYLFNSGIDVITLGNHTWSKSEMIKSIEYEDYVIRPANVSSNWPGRGFCIKKTDKGNVLVINLLGRVGMGMLANCPFERADEMLADIKSRHDIKVTVIDFHAEATAEKQAFARYLDGRVSFVAGTHTHVQTADETIFERGTGYITDVGMTGPVDSIIGMNTESSIKRFVEKLPVHYLVADGFSKISAVVAEIDENTGKTINIKRINVC